MLGGTSNQFQRNVIGNEVGKIHFRDRVIIDFSLTGKRAAGDVFVWNNPNNTATDKKIACLFYFKSSILPTTAQLATVVINFRLNVIIIPCIQKYVGEKMRLRKCEILDSNQQKLTKSDTILNCFYLRL